MNADELPVVIVTCPYCSGTGFAMLELAMCVTPIKCFVREESGVVRVGGFSGMTEPDWRTSEPVEFPWRCLSCGEEMGDEDLIVTNAV